MKLLFNGSRHGEASANEDRYHNYNDYIHSDPFTAPLVRPSQRIEELLENESILEMASRSGLSESELMNILYNSDLEPTTRQLLKLSSSHKLSVLWLLGYHTKKERHNADEDKEIINAISLRNAIEQQAKKDRPKGLFASLIIKNYTRRLLEANSRVAAVISEIMIREHLAFSTDELRFMEGRPVYICSYHPSNGDWGICGSRIIYMRGKSISFDDINSDYYVYMAPKPQLNTVFFSSKTR